MSALLAIGALALGIVLVVARVEGIVLLVLYAAYVTAAIGVTVGA